MDSNERYKRMDVLASGGQAILYVVLDRWNGHRFVWKEMSLCEAEREREILLHLQKLNSRLFPGLHGYFTKEGKGCLILEYLQGMNLLQLAEQGCISDGLLLLIMKEVLQGLRLLHNLRPAVIWGDLKAENIMVMDGWVSDSKERRDSVSIRLIDFGAAIRSGEPPAISPKFGTACYAAPEQKWTEGICDERTDLYAFGAVFGELGEKILPRSVQKILRICMQLNPEERYQTAAQVLYELHKLG